MPSEAERGAVAHIAQFLIASGPPLPVFLPAPQVSQPGDRLVMLGGDLEVCPEVPAGLSSREVGDYAESLQSAAVPRELLYDALHQIGCFRPDLRRGLFEKMLDGELTWQDLQGDHVFFEGVMGRTADGFWHIAWGS